MPVIYGRCTILYIDENTKEIIRAEEPFLFYARLNLSELTGLICPLTRCPKGLLNGPCGGQNKGKCEVDKDRDCAWILILDLLKEIKPPKDHSKTSKPRQLSL
jgi:hypothetical protein